ncbi:MAG: helix-turn-helix domain-containing protein [Verrucomicrobia bacterium]|nr:helix-turn-helix domain-containing protein [Verrucomicrobiota bacterium]
MARPKLAITLSAEQRRELARLVKAPATPQKFIRRARVALLAAAGEDNAAIATRLRTSRVTVGVWRQRFLDAGCLCQIRIRQ